jgi:hypothetical protein
MWGLLERLSRQPARRALLRLAINSEAPSTSKALAGALDFDLNKVRYDIRELIESVAFEIVDERAVRGAIRHYYLPTELAHHPVLLGLLALPEPDPAIRQAQVVTDAMMAHEEGRLL